MSREYTNRLLELVDEGMFDRDILIRNILSFMSEQDVKDFVKCEDYFGFEDLDPEYLAHLEDQAQEDMYCRETALWYDTSAELL
jgi:hypothetical protein